MFQRYVEKPLALEPHVATIGTGFSLKSIVVDNKVYTIQLWDTPPQNHFRTITSSYYRGAHGIILVFSLDSREEYERMETYACEVRKYAFEGVITQLIGLRTDTTAARKVTQEQGQKLADKYSMPYVEVHGDGLQEMEAYFEGMARLFQERRVAAANKETQLPEDSITVPATQRPHRKHCLIS